MLNTFIENKGVNQTIIHNNNKSHINEVGWNADYDGNTANISVTTNSDGVKQHYDATLDNLDLDKLLNISSVNIPLHERLAKDFSGPLFKHEPKKYFIELPDTDSDDSVDSISDQMEGLDLDLDKGLQNSRPNSYLSSPLANEEIILPITIDEQKHKRHKYTLTPKKHHIRKKTHQTYKAYKKRKSPSKLTTIRHRRSKSKTRRKKTDNSLTSSILSVL